MTNKRKNSSQSTASHSRGKKEEDVQAKRPKRLIVTKNVDESTGLSWREETDLKRALYASLQESKRLSRGQEEEEGVSPSTKLMTHHHHQHHGRVTRGLMGAPVRKPSTVGRFNQDESSQESGTSSSTHESKKTTVHAQRKFAQGHSQPSTPSTTPVKVHSTPVKLFSKRAKTEDFLTFLCLRGSSVLPPHLDFFGYSRDEHQAGESSRPNTPGHGVRSDSGETRESTPDLSSSSDSDMRDEVPELANLIMKNQHTPTRKAARASASTPETARGLASIRPSVAKKANKVPAKDLLRRSKVFLTKPNKMSPRSERALLRHQRSPSKSVRTQACFVDLGHPCDPCPCDLSSVDWCEYHGSLSPRHEQDICYSSTLTLPFTSDTVTIPHPPTTCSTGAPQIARCHNNDTTNCLPVPGLNCIGKPCTPKGIATSPCFKVPLDPDVVNEPGLTKHELYYSVFSCEKPVAHATCVPLPSPPYNVLKCLDFSSQGYPAKTQLDPEVPQTQLSVCVGSLPCKGNSSADKSWAESKGPSLADDLTFPELRLNLSNDLFEANEAMMNLFEKYRSDLLDKGLPGKSEAHLLVPNDHFKSQALLLSEVEVNVSDPVYSETKGSPKAVSPMLDRSTRRTERDPTMSNQWEEQEDGKDHDVHSLMGSTSFFQDLEGKDKCSTQHKCSLNDKCPVMESNLDIKEAAVMNPPGRGTTLYPLPPVCVSVQPLEGSGKKSGSDFKPSDAVSSKPVRASATPSKKRITPQSLPIGSMPKFYIDDSDSSVQSRDSKDTTTSRRGKLSIIPKPPQPVKQKSKIIKGKDQPKQEIPIKPTVKPAKKLSSVKKVRDKKNVASKTKTKETGPSGRKVTRLKEKGATNVRKKRRATLSKNYAEDVDDDLDSVDDLEVLKHSKKTSLMKKGRDKRSESRRKIVAASLAKMAASKKLSNIKRKKQQSKKAKAEVNMDASSAIARKARQAKAAKVRESIESQQSRHSNVKSSASSPRRRGRPRSLSSTPSKEKADTPTNFPAPEDGGHIVEVPTFYPSAKEFLDPHQYIASIRCQAEPYGMCRVVPPASWKPECKVNDELRFTSQLQYIHKMQNRWGPNVQQMECIRKHLASINVELDQPPLIGGIEVDLPKLLHTMQVFGGAQNVGDKKTWIKVADAMKIPKLAQDRATKLYDAYCKYLLSYDTLSYEEKTKLEHQVWMERQKKLKTQKMVDDSVVKGRSMSLGDFNRVARNTVSMWFKEEPFVEQVECEYWKLVQEGQGHVVVQCGHVDTRLQGSAFPVRRDSPCSRHGWNFNVLPQNPKSLLKSMGPVTGVTIPTLHIGMLFTTSCWSTDLHLLPYIQYLHTGADTVWYSVPQSEEEKFKSALTTIVPDLVTDNDTWLSEDTVMVSPDALSQKGVSLGRCVQKPGQFMVVFSNCHTATVSCGYSISESVHFAYADWIPIGVEASKRLNQMGEPELFSVEGFLCNLIKESSSLDILGVALPQLKSIIDCETGKAQQLIEDGLKITKQMAVVKESVSPAGSGKRKTLESVGRDDCVCDICKKVCHLFMVVSDPDESVFCLDHAAPFVQRKKNFKGCRLLYRYTEEELAAIVKSAEDKLEEAVEREAPEKPSSGPRRRSVSLRSAANSGSS